MASSLSKELFTKVVGELLKAKFAEIESLNDEQYKALWEFINRKDVLAILPTGFGKSLIFQLVPDLCIRLNALNLPYPNAPILIVVCPLNSLIDSHLRELDNHGISATSLSNDELDESGIFAGKYSVIFANPESLIKNAKWREMLRTKVYQNNLCGIVTDEAHVIPKWGQDDTKEKQLAFRECFGRLGELRSLMPQCPVTPVLALTATATLKIKKKVIESLSLREDMVLIDVNPNRPNIYLTVCKISNDLNGSFQWLVQKLMTEKNTVGQTLIYCKSIKDCGRIFTYFKNQLGKNAYYPLDAEQTSQNMLVGMYHHATLPRHKERIVNSLHDTLGVCRIVVATNALGMGVNFKEIRAVIHYGPPRHMDDFIQEIGRAGRDNQPAVSMLMYTGMLLRKCDAQMKLYASNMSKCLREILLQEFESKFTPHHHLHNCCTVCHRKCSCLGSGQCGVKLKAYEVDEDCSIPLPHISSPEQRSRVVAKQQKSLLKDLLVDMKQDIHSSDTFFYLSPDSSTGFTDSLINLVVQKCKYIFDVEYILKNLPVFKVDHAIEILCIINDVFEDIEDCDVPSLDQCTREADAIDLHEYDLEYGGEYNQDMENILSSYSSDSDVSVSASNNDE